MSSEGPATAGEDSADAPAPPGPAPGPRGRVGRALRRVLRIGLGAGLLVGGALVLIWTQAPEEVVAAGLRVARGRLRARGWDLRVDGVEARSPLDATLRGVALHALPATPSTTLPEVELEAASLTYALPARPLLDLLLGRSPPARSMVHLAGEELRVRSGGRELARLETAHLEGSLLELLQGRVRAGATLRQGRADLPGLRDLLEASRPSPPRASPAPSPAAEGALPLSWIEVEDLVLVLGAPHDLRILRARLRAAAPGEVGDTTLVAEVEGGGGRASVDLRQLGPGGRVQGAVRVRDLPVPGIPVWVEPEVAVGGHLAGHLTVDLDPARPEDLSSCGGTLTATGVRVLLEGEPVLEGAEASLAVTAATARLEARASRARAGPYALRELALRGRLSRSGLALEELRAAVEGHPGAGLRARLEVSDLSSPWEHARGRASVTDLPVLGLPGAPGASPPRLDATLSWAPEHLVLDVPRVSVAGAHPMTLRGALRATPRSLEVTATGAVAELEVPRFGVVRAEGRGQLTAPLPAPTGAVPASLAALARNPAARARLAPEWSPESLRFQSRAGDRLDLERPLAGTLSLEPLRVEVTGTEVDLEELRIRLGGAVAAAPDAELRVEVEDLGLRPLVELLVPDGRLGGRGHVDKARLHLRALLGEPSLEGTIELSGEPGLGVWSMEPDGAHRRGVSLPPGHVTVHADAGELRLLGPGLHLRRDRATGTATLQLEDLALRVEEELHPARRVLRGAAARLDADLLFPDGDPARASGRMAASVTSLRPTTAAPAAGALRVRLAPEAVSLEEAHLEDGQGQRRLDLVGGVSAREPTPTRLRLDGFPLTWLGSLGLRLPGALRVDLDVDGTLGALPGEEAEPVLERLQGLPTRRALLRRAGATVEVRALGVQGASGELARLAAPVTLRLHQGTLRVGSVDLRIGGRALRAEGALSFLEPSDFRVSTDHLAVGPLLDLLGVPTAPEARGTLDGSLSLRGSFPDLDLSGTVEAAGLSLRLPGLDSRLEGGLVLRGDARGATLEAPGLRLDGVPLTLSGRLPLEAGEEPTATLAVRAEDLVLRRGRSRLTGIDLELDARDTLPALQGSVRLVVRVGGGTLVLDDLGPLFLLRRALALARAPPRAEGAPLGPAALPDRRPPAELDWSLRVTNPVQVRSPLVDLSVTARADLRSRPGAAPLLTAEVEAPRGSVFLHRTEFRIERARGGIRYDGATVTTRLDLRAAAAVRDHRVRLEVQGPMDAPEVRLESTPARTEAELLHLLTTGRLPGEAAALASAASGVRDFYLTSTFNRALSSSLGLSGVRVRQDGGVARVEVERQLGDRTRASYTRGLDASETLRLEYRIGGATVVEAGRQTDLEGSRPFVGVKRRLRLR